MPWVADGIDGLESSSLDSLHNIATNDVELAKRVFRLTWFADGLTYPEKEAVRLLDSMTEKDPALAERVADYPSFADGVTAHESGTFEYLDKIAATDLAMASVIASYSWIQSDITEFGRLALEYLHRIVGRNPTLARKVADYDWISDEMTRRQSNVLGYLHRLMLANANAANIVASFPWVGDDMLDHEGRALATISEITRFPEYRELADLVMQLPWVADDMSEIEQHVLESLRGITLSAPELGRLVANFPWVVDSITEDEQRTIGSLSEIVWHDQEFTEFIVTFPWMADEITTAERHAIETLTAVDRTHPQAALLLASLPWVNDGITETEQRAIRSLASIVQVAPTLAQTVAGLPWVVDDVTETESEALDALRAAPAEKVRLLLELAQPAAGPGDDPSQWNIPLLVTLGRLDQETFDELMGVPWFADGVDDEEGALLVALPQIRRASPNLYNDLVQTRHTESETILLPLAGEVDLWVFQPTPLPQGENLIGLLEDVVRATEGLLRAPFPTNQVILLVPIIGTDKDHGFQGGGIFWGDFITATRIEPWWIHRNVIYHEVAHYYFYRPPVWLAEGGAEFLMAYTNDLVGFQSLEERKPIVWSLVETSCLKEGIQNIAQLLESYQRHVCNYYLGAYFLLELLEALGEEATGSALGELFLLTVSKNSSVTEEEIYRAFLRHTPEGLMEEFRDIYRRLHGGPYADEEE